MFALSIVVLRYVFLLLLFLSILKLIKWMIRDLKKIASQNEDKRPGHHRAGTLAAETGAGAELVVVESSLPELKPGIAIAAGQEVLLGRDGSCDINIGASFASARHARIYLKEGQYWLEDFKSTNGTFLNEIQVSGPIVLANGDRVRIGSVIFQFVRWGYEVDAGN
ncbi:MAG: FHA domain-containing protein FhaB [Pelotomaculum sp. PtaB.Bin104]|nr:MAG: FHA domain-containing protein FhaB [Pelotomaculum sp. PtaB.Bin104]